MRSKHPACGSELSQPEGGYLIAGAR
jgi:hypothetical protein